MHSVKFFPWSAGFLDFARKLYLNFTKKNGCDLTFFWNGKTIFKGGHYQGFDKKQRIYFARVDDNSKVMVSDMDYLSTVMFTQLIQTLCNAFRRVMLVSHPRTAWFSCQKVWKIVQQKFKNSVFSMKPFKKLNHTCKEVIYTCKKINYTCKKLSCAC